MIEEIYTEVLLAAAAYARWDQTNQGVRVLESRINI